MALPTASKLLLKMGEESTVCFNEAKAEITSLGWEGVTLLLWFAVSLQLDAAAEVMETL